MRKKIDKCPICGKKLNLIQTLAWGAIRPGCLECGYELFSKEEGEKAIVFDIKRNDVIEGGLVNEFCSKFPPAMRVEVGDIIQINYYEGDNYYNDNLDYARIVNINEIEKERYSFGIVLLEEKDGEFEEKLYANGMSVCDIILPHKVRKWPWEF